MNKQYKKEAILLAWLALTLLIAWGLAFAIGRFLAG